MARTFQNEQALASAPIGPLMLRLAAPAVAAQLINVLYNIVDRIYIGHIAVVGKTALTGTDYEPWHYRYVGKDAAKAIHDQGICLEEYLGVSQ